MCQFRRGGLILTILDEIVEYKQSLIKEGYYTSLLQQLKMPKHIQRQKLVESLNHNSKLSIIAEIKSKSPSVSSFKSVDLSVQVENYTQYGASAISILTDEKYFGGSFQRLAELSEKTNLPILCKDFIIDTIQIDVAKKLGASIILLIVNCLSDHMLKTLYDYATSLDMEVLVEVHDREELQRAHLINPKIIGVNNRDLKTFNIDIQHTNQILNNNTKENIAYISESGIHSVEDVEAVNQGDIDGLLVGGALMDCEKISEFLPSLMLEKQK